MKVIKASVVAPNDTGRIIYVSLAEAILLKALLRNVQGHPTNSLRSVTKNMTVQFSASDVFINGPELLSSFATFTEGSIAKLQENVNENIQ